MLEAGEGGPVDARGGSEYYEAAANYGVAEAQYNLGMLLARDHNHETSLVSAYKWLVLAENAVKQSAEAAQEVRKSLTPQQFDQAEQAINEWRAAHVRRPAAQ